MVLSGAMVLPEPKQRDAESAPNQAGVRVCIVAAVIIVVVLFVATVFILVVRDQLWQCSL